MEDSPPERSGGARHEHETNASRPSKLGRRKFLAGAVVAGTAAWAVPAIVTMEPAGAAALTSPPPEVEVLPNRVTPGDPGGPAVEVAAAKVPDPPRVEVLAKAGAPIDVLLGAGAAAIAGGGALHEWSARAARRTVGSADASAVPEPPDAPGDGPTPS